MKFEPVSDHVFSDELAEYKGFDVLRRRILPTRNQKYAARYYRGRVYEYELRNEGERAGTATSLQEAKKWIQEHLESIG